MATKKTSKKPALKLVKTSTTKTDREVIIREFLKIVWAVPLSTSKEGMADFQNNPFAWGASQVNTDLALAAHCELERDFQFEDDDFFNFFWSSEFQKLQQTFKEEVETEESYALVGLVWRAYKAGRLSPERLEPDSESVRAERRRVNDYWDKEHEKVMAAKQAAK
jgi:hypothetical protein